MIMERLMGHLIIAPKGVYKNWYSQEIPEPFSGPYTTYNGFMAGHDQSKTTETIKYLI